MGARGTGPMSEQNKPYDVGRVVELLTVKRGETPWHQTFFAFSVSLALFVVFGAMAWRPETLLAVVAALIIHEGGHMAAMMLLGYRNLKMIFIPFIGGFASGDNDEERIADVAIITLTGPIVGLITAVISGILYSQTGIDAFIYYTRMAVFINVLNLLPLYPLDGGRFFNDLLFSRSIKVEIAIKVVTGLVIFAAGIYFRELLLVAIGAVVLVPLQMTLVLHRITEGYRAFLNGRRASASRDDVNYLASELVGKMKQFRKTKTIDQALANQIRMIIRKVNGSRASKKEVGWLFAVYACAVVVLPALAIVGAR